MNSEEFCELLYAETSDIQCGETAEESNRSSHIFQITTPLCEYPGKHKGNHKSPSSLLVTIMKRPKDFSVATFQEFVLPEEQQRQERV